MFVNRDNELNYLNNEWKTGGAKMVVIYGRRRVGKTALINEFIKKKRAMYFFADKMTEREQLMRFQSTVFGYFGEKIEGMSFENWDGIFEYVCSKISRREKLIMAIDEFQYLVKANPAIPSIIQRIWDEKLKEKNVFLILCGSMMGMMYETALSYGSPLYGRRTGQILLKQMGFKDVGKFFPGKSRKELVEYYSVLGGVPQYINQFNRRLSLIKNIEYKILEENAFLYNEPRYILSEEITESMTYFSILKTISFGERKIGNIASRLGVKPNNLNKYILTLEEMGLLEREVPVTEKNPRKSKKGLYSIKDNYFRFWFRFVFPNQDKLEVGKSSYVAGLIKRSLNEYIGENFHEISKEMIMTDRTAGSLPFKIEKIGRWWNGSSEIDLVGFDEGFKNVIFFECKWTGKKTELNILKSLMEKSKNVYFEKNVGQKYFGIISKSGFSEGLIRESKKDKRILLCGIEK